MFHFGQWCSTPVVMALVLHKTAPLSCFNKNSPSGCRTMFVLCNWYTSVGGRTMTGPNKQIFLNTKLADFREKHRYHAPGWKSCFSPWKQPPFPIMNLKCQCPLAVRPSLNGGLKSPEGWGQETEKGAPSRVNKVLTHLQLKVYLKLSFWCI